MFFPLNGKMYLTMAQSQVLFYQAAKPGGLDCPWHGLDRDSNQDLILNLVLDSQEISQKFQKLGSNSWYFSIVKTIQKYT